MTENHQEVQHKQPTLEKQADRVERKSEHKAGAEAGEDLKAGSLNDATKAKRQEQFESGNSGATGQGDQHGRFRSAKEIFGDSVHTPLTKEAEAKREAVFKNRGWDSNELQGNPEHANIQEKHKDGSVLLKVNEPIADQRNPGEKLQDLMQAATKRATDPEGWKAWMQGEINKLSGIPEGLNEAKNETKTAVAAGWKAMTDGTVTEFLSHPNAINEPLFKTVSNVFDAMGKDPNATNKALEALGGAVMKASDEYSNLPEHDKGKVWGKGMFGMVNPEGSTEAAEAALKIGKNGLEIGEQIAIHVDKAVIDTVQLSLKAAADAAKSAPEIAEQTKQMLYDYLKSKGLTGPEFKIAGVPKGYFDNMQSPPGGGKGDNFLAMSKADDLGGEAIEVKGGGMDSAGRNLSFSQESGIELGSVRQGQDKVWEQAPFPRGDDVHVVLGENLPAGTKTIDRVVFRDGIAEGQKSIDLTADTYAAANKLESKLRGYVHDMEIYDGQPKMRMCFRMKKYEIDQKILHIGIKDGSMTAVQKAVFESVGKEVQNYNKNLPIGIAPLKLKVTVVK